MNKADLNTLDDWWNEGFDDFFAGVPFALCAEIDGPASRHWSEGYRAAAVYQNSLRNGALNE